jgi:hypothetical protein
MARRQTLRSQLYRAARDLGNVQAPPRRFRPPAASGSIGARCRGPALQVFITDHEEDDICF